MFNRTKDFLHEVKFEAGRNKKALLRAAFVATATFFGTLLSFTIDNPPPPPRPR